MLFLMVVVLARKMVVPCMYTPPIPHHCVVWKGVSPVAAPRTGNSSTPNVEVQRPWLSHTDTSMRPGERHGRNRYHRELRGSSLRALDFLGASMMKPMPLAAPTDNNLGRTFFFLPCPSHARTDETDETDETEPTKLGHLGHDEHLAIPPLLRLLPTRAGVKVGPTALSRENGARELHFLRRLVGGYVGVGFWSIISSRAPRARESFE